MTFNLSTKEGQGHIWGLLEKERYATQTKAKKKWYEKHFPGRLIESIEGNDVSTQIKTICKDRFGITLKPQNPTTD